MGSEQPKACVVSYGGVVSDMPWFPFYVDRFLGSRKTRRMSAESVGVYTLLLIDQWKNGPIPDDDADLVFATRADVSIARDVLEQCFTLTPDGWVNEALGDIEAEQEAKRQRRADAGRKGGRAKRQPKQPQPLTSTTQAMLKQAASNAEAVDKIREEEIRETARGEGFDALWAELGSGNLLPAESAYWRAVPDKVSHVDLMTARRSYVARLSDPKYMTGLGKWIDQGGYEDPTLKTKPRNPQNRPVVRSANGTRFVT